MALQDRLKSIQETQNTAPVEHPAQSKSAPPKQNGSLQEEAQTAGPVEKPPEPAQNGQGLQDIVDGNGSAPPPAERSVPAKKAEESIPTDQIPRLQAWLHDQVASNLEVMPAGDDLA